MQCRTCQGVFLEKSLQLDADAIQYWVCDGCSLFLVPGLSLHVLLPDTLLERIQASNKSCPVCTGIFLETTDRALAGKALLHCRKCRLLEIDREPGWSPSNETTEKDRLEEFLDAAVLLLQHEQQQHKTHQLPAAFQVEDAQNTDLKCPCCVTALTRYRVFDARKEAAADFEICDTCFGIWLDRDDLLGCHVPRQEERLEVDFTTIQPSSRTCPKCRDINLVALRFRSPDTEIDCCPSCFGTWLDGGELQEFCDFLGKQDHDVIDALIDNAVFQNPALCNTLKHFSRTLHQLDGQVQEQHKNLQQAREIQSRLVFGGGDGMGPTTVGSYQVLKFWQPARAVGGDYFDLIQFQSGGAPCLGICIADVSGKGLPASLLMANFQALLRAFAPSTPSPAELCARLNSVLYHNTTPNKYITAVYGVLNLETHRFTFTNAGHNPPIYAQGQACSFMKTGGTVLGLFPSWSFTEKIVDLKEGDRILFYTDGVSEAANQLEEDFGEERLMRLLGDLRGESLAKAHQLLVLALKEFCLGKFHDDATTLLLERAVEKE